MTKLHDVRYSRSAVNAGKSPAPRGSCALQESPPYGADVLFGRHSTLLIFRTRGVVAYVRGGANAVPVMFPLWYEEAVWVGGGMIVSVLLEKLENSANIRKSPRTDLPFWSQNSRGFFRLPSNSRFCTVARQWEGNGTHKTRQRMITAAGSARLWHLLLRLPS